MPECIGSRVVGGFGEVRSVDLRCHRAGAHWQSRAGPVWPSEAKPRSDAVDGGERRLKAETRPGAG